MMRRRFILWRLFLVLGLVAILGGCVGMAPPAPTALELSDTQMRQIVQQRMALQSWQGLASVHCTWLDGRSTSSATQALHVQRPNRLRVEVFGVFGQQLMLMAASGSHMAAYVPSQQTFYSGLPSRERVEHFTGVPLTVPELVALLLGQLPEMVWRLATVRAQGQSLIYDVGAGEFYQVQFENGMIRTITCLRLGQTVYEACYEQPDADNSFPRQLTLQVPDRGLTVQVKLEGLDLNPQLDEALFELTSPPGSQLLPLEAL
ncbi:MAG: DUF4292 domain-containing protein [Desulfuromonadaceae bacterium]|nr:DUF4292 domain-containing protein [Desulfuromonadaceae bacterium]